MKSAKRDRASSNPLLSKVMKAADENRRLIAPLVTFPGLSLTGCSVKLAQQNFGEHFKVVKAVADTFHPDLIFPLMDLSVEANAIGSYTVFPRDETASVLNGDFNIAELSAGERVNISFDTRLLGYVETMKMMSIGLPVEILRGAYVTGPYTLAALLMGAEEAAAATIERRELLHEVCSFAMGKIQQYVRLLVASGAQLVCVLEPSAVMLGPGQFQEFSAEYVRRMCEVCTQGEVSVLYHICGNSMHIVDAMAESGVDALSLDSPDAGVDLPAVAERVGDKVVVIGNINPTGRILHGTSADVEKDVLRLLDDMKACRNFVLSTGCDLPQETPIENIKTFMEAGRRYRLS